MFKRAFARLRLSDPAGGLAPQTPQSVFGPMKMMERREVQRKRATHLRRPL